MVSPPKSTQDQIYEHIMGLIQTGQIAPGERLVETKIAKSLELSRTPVREALRRLEQDFIVERHPQGGVRVTEVTQDMVQDIFGIRLQLEPYAAQLACDGISHNDIQHLRGLEKVAQGIITAKDMTLEAKMSKLLDLNTLFHERVYEASGNVFLIKLINNLRHMVVRIRIVGLRQDSAWSNAWKEHGQLIDLLENRDKEAVLDLMKRHIQSAACHAAANASKAANIQPKLTKQA